jgi:hypothetical protein
MRGKNVLLISGFFLRRTEWIGTRYQENKISCFDSIRDDPSVSMKYYLDYLSKFILSRREKTTILAHSFGGSVALHIFQKLPHKIDRVILFSGIISFDNPVFLAYVKSGQSIMNEVCYFDRIKAALRLKDHRKFQHLLGICKKHQKDNLDHIEPIDMILSPVKALKNFSQIKKVTYVVCRKDKITNIVTQKQFSHSICNRMIYYPGSHCGSIQDPFFMRKILLNN